MDNCISQCDRCGFFLATPPQGWVLSALCDITQSWDVDLGRSAHSPPFRFNCYTQKLATYSQLWAWQEAGQLTGHRPLCSPPGRSWYCGRCWSRPWRAGRSPAPPSPWSSCGATTVNPPPADNCWLLAIKHISHYCWTLFVFVDISALQFSQTASSTGIKPIQLDMKPVITAAYGWIKRWN